MIDIEARRILIRDMESLKANPLVTVDDCLYKALDKAINVLGQGDVLEKIRADIKAKIEEEEFARSVFRHEEKDTYKAEQCTGSIMAYNNVIKFIDKYKAESEDKE